MSNSNDNKWYFKILSSNRKMIITLNALKITPWDIETARTRDNKSRYYSKGVVKKYREHQRQRDGETVQKKKKKKKKKDFEYIFQENSGAKGCPKWVYDKNTITPILIKGTMKDLSPSHRRPLTVPV